MSAAPDMIDRSATVERFLQSVAARTPTPGGGSVTALCGALAAAIGEMTLRYSLGRKGQPPTETQQLEPVLKELERARELLLQLMVEDQAAYISLTALKRQPADSPGRAQQLAEATLTCIRIPQTVAVTGAAILDLCRQVVELINPRLLSDWAVCAELAMATVRCGSHNVRVNLADAPADQRPHFESAMDSLCRRSAATVTQVIHKIWQRHGQKV